MARLNELPMASESFETLQRKMYRQNRDLARSNNVRGLRIKELEKDCVRMQSENLDLRGRIVELERQIEDNETRRITDQALAIKAKLESQLAEWGTFVAGLGLEAPPKRQSPETRKSIKKRRTSFTASRPSPSQRRLRDVAKDVEELGHISENKSYQRRSMNPEQILALRSEADISSDSIDLGPPPVSHFVEDTSGLDSPIRGAAERTSEQDPEEILAAEEEETLSSVPSPKSMEDASIISSPFKPEDQTVLALTQPEPEDEYSKVPATQPLKIGSKRKRTVRDDGGHAKEGTRNDSKIARTSVEKSSIRQKTGSKASKEMDDEDESGAGARKPLASKSTNDDISSVLKNSQSKASVLEEKTPCKVTTKSNSTKTKSKTVSTNRPGTLAVLEVETTETTEIIPAIYDLATPITEAALLAPNTPEPPAAIEAPRGDTPPPADISFKGETSRPSRRNRGTVSYAEPNLRDKMRRPTKALLDAVAGEGKYRRRTSHNESDVPDPTQTYKVKPEPPATNKITTTGAMPHQPEPETLPASPLTGEDLPLDILPSSVVTERRKRYSNVVSNAKQTADKSVVDNEMEIAKDVSINSDHSELKDADVYEFTGSSPQGDKLEKKGGKRSHRRQTTTSRRSSVAVDGETDRSTTRRRSMII